jgi:Na+-driven multidrug efflux pump
VSRRLLVLGTILGVVVAAVLAPFARSLAGAFSGDPDVIAVATSLLLWVAAIQPLSGAAFTLDGILIGASDTRYLAAAMVVCSLGYVALAVGALSFEWGVRGLATAATAWLILRTISTYVRYRGRGWVMQS